MAKFDDLLQAVKVHEVLKSKEENEKKCKFCYVIAAIAELQQLQVQHMHCTVI